jgi:hypothetical protein
MEKRVELDENLQNGQCGKGLELAEDVGNEEEERNYLGQIREIMARGTPKGDRTGTGEWKRSAIPILSALLFRDTLHLRHASALQPPPWFWTPKSEQI